MYWVKKKCLHVYNQRKESFVFQFKILINFVKHFKHKKINGFLNFKCKSNIKEMMKNIMNKYK